MRKRMICQICDTPVWVETIRNEDLPDPREVLCEDCAEEEYLLRRFEENMDKDD